MNEIKRKYRHRMIWLIVFSALLLALAAVCLWGAWENGAVQLTQRDVSCSGLPAGFEGYTVAHVSDLHNTPFGEQQAGLRELLAEAEPDIIVVTGDVIDKRRPGTKHALDFFSVAVEIAPVYYVPGNHEAVSEEYPALRSALEGLGVNVLDDRRVTLTRGGDSVTLVGVSDPIFTTREAERNADLMREKLQTLLPGEGFTMLLSHRPELFSVYRERGVDLTFSGHAHGGQFRLPWGQGMVAPNQGLFPKYTQGVYEEEGKLLAVSRGLGNSSIPIRLNNRPEIVRLTLHVK